MVCRTYQVRQIEQSDPELDRLEAEAPLYERPEGDRTPAATAAASIWSRPGGTTMFSAGVPTLL